MSDLSAISAIRLNVFGLRAPLSPDFIASNDAAIALKASIATTVQTQGRPGDVLDRFTTSLTGSATNAAPVTAGTIVTDANGSVLRVTGATYLGTRERISTDPAASIRFRYAAIRNTDPTDPSGATLRFGLQFLTNAKTNNGQHVVRDITLHVADGRQTETFTIAAADAAGIDFVWPAGTCYVVPFIQTFDVDGVTDFQLIQWEDATDILALSASGDESVGAVAADLVTERGQRIATDAALSARTAVIEGEVTRGVGAGLTIQDSAGYVLASIDQVAIHHPQIDRIDKIAKFVGAVVVTRPGGGWAVEDGRGNMLIEVTPSAINHPVISALVANMAPLAGATKRMGAGFAIEDKAGYRLLYADPKTFAHPTIAQLQAVAYRPRDPQWNDIQANAQLIGVPIYGESTSRGESARPTISTDAMPAGAYRYVGGMRPDDAGGTSASQHASIVAANESAAGSLYETPATGALRMILQLLASEDGLDPTAMGQAFLASCDGQNGQTATQLSNGSAYFQRLKDSTSYGPARALDLGLKTYAPGFLGYVQGHNDYPANTTTSSYITTVEQILADYTAFVQTVTGVARRVPMIIDQVASHLTSAKTNPNIAIAQLQLALTQDMICLATPSYVVPYNPGGNPHWIAIGSLQIGAYIGLAAKRWLWDGIKPQPFVPTVERSGNAILAHFPVAPGRKLVLHQWATLANYGATIVDSGGTDIPVTAVQLIGRDKVAIVTGSTIPSGAHLHLGWIGTTGDQIGRTGFRDDEPLTFDPDGWRLPMWRFAPICDLTVS